MHNVQTALKIISCRQTEETKFHRETMDLLTLFLVLDVVTCFCKQKYKHSMEAIFFLNTE